MSASANNIWRVPAYLPYLQPELTGAMIREAEGEIGHSLPASYISLLQVQNGGYIRYTLPNRLHDQIWGIGPHFPSITGVDWGDCREHVSYELDGLIPFDGDGHWYLCLDYRRRNSPPVVTYVDVECDSESAIAPSFDDYLAGLRVEVNEQELVLSGVSDVKRTLDELAGFLKLEFESPDTYAHGYPIYRARGGAKASPEWIWLSPNLVPRGFVRSDDPRYEELRNLMPGSARRYPELADASYLLAMTDGLRTAVLRACKQLSIDVRPLGEYVI